MNPAPFPSATLNTSTGEYLVELYGRMPYSDQKTFAILSQIHYINMGSRMSTLVSTITRKRIISIIEYFP